VIAWFLAGLGLLLGLAGMTVVVSVRSVGRMELYRWVAARTDAAHAARALLAARSQVVGAGLGISSVGALIAGLAARAMLDGMPLLLLLVSLLVAAVPLYLVLAYALPRVMGRRWAEPVIKLAVPGFRRLAPLLAAPNAGTARPRDAANASDGRESGAESDSEELVLVSGVLNFSERPVREVMTPRTDVVALGEGVPAEAIGRVFAESGFSRIPVYRDSLDDIVGMVYAFDLLKLLPGNELAVRPVAIVHGSKPCADLLFEMQRERRQMAVVLDEYGGTAGIATLQDLLEELVGETFETVDVSYRTDPSADEFVEVSGTTAAEDISAKFDVELPGTAETVSGLLSRAAGRIPRAGERYELAGLEFDILAASATRVERVAVRRGLTPVIHLSSVRTV